jgi:hypothetical protein
MQIAVNFGFTLEEGYALMKVVAEITWPLY